MVPEALDADCLATKDRVAAELARRYYENDPALTRIIRYSDPERESDLNEPIKLLEVYRDAIPSGVILPIGFPAHAASGIRFATEVIQIAPQELERVRSSELRLPDGWVVSREFEPPDVPSQGGP